MRIFREILATVLLLASIALFIPPPPSETADLAHMGQISWLQIVVFIAARTVAVEFSRLRIFLLLVEVGGFVVVAYLFSEALKLLMSQA